MVNKRLNESLWIFLGDMMRLDGDAVINVQIGCCMAPFVEETKIELLVKCKLLGRV